MFRIQIRSPDNLVFAGLYTAQAVASLFWAIAYPKSGTYLLLVPGYLAIGSLWAWRATGKEPLKNPLARTRPVTFSLALVLLVGLLCWGAYTAPSKTGDLRAAQIGYAVMVLALVAGASYYLFARRLILARKSTLKKATATD